MQEALKPCSQGMGRNQAALQMEFRGLPWVTG